ncbi:MAG: trehalase family glycosidase [Aquihabitans sp.]
MDELGQQAADVLRRNDRGGWTRPSPELYPHQWSWDAAFVAIGWAHLDPIRAVAELQSLFVGQWSNGMLPHVVFDPTVAAGAYEPGPEAWSSAGHSPFGVATSAICQPPVHALALQRVREVSTGSGPEVLDAVDTAIADLYPRLARWHRWLRSARDPHGTGLITILHPWESGLDNSPRWDDALARIDPSVGPDGPRPDLDVVGDPAQRPTDDDYRRYRFLLERLIAVDHDQAQALRSHPFRMHDVWFSAILAASDDALADLAVVVGMPEAAEGHRADGDNTRAGLDRCWDTDLARCRDIDLVGGAPVAADTIAGFAPLVAGTNIDRTAKLVDRLWSPSYAGNPSLTWALPPTTAVDDPAFDARSYWRGPQWPPMTWLLWRGLRRAGHRRSASRLRQTALDQLRATGCTEYVEPCTGEPLGSRDQSWTAAVALDWLATTD